MPGNLQGKLLDTRLQICYNDYQVITIINSPMSSIDHFCAQLKARGRRVTPQRRAIIQVLLEDHAHLTAEQVFTRVRDTMPDLSPATVYNTLHELVEMGALRELDVGPGGRLYEVTKGPHAHLVCLGCGRVEDIRHKCEAQIPSPQQAHGFRVVDCNVVFRGYCPACAAEADDRTGIHHN